ncbi:MAG: tetratricopeptide repeat protein [Hyphomicrobiaceae bacterium]
MRSTLRYFSSVALAGIGAVTLAFSMEFAAAQQSRPQQPPTQGAGQGTAAAGAACFAATDPAAIIAGCDAFLSAGRSGATADQTGLALQRRGGARAALGRIEQAISDFREMASSGFKVHEAQVSIGSLEFRRQRLNAAEAAYREALKVNPSYALAHVGLGHTLIALNKPAEAVGHFDRALATSETDTGAHLGKGTALAATGDFDGAIRSFDAALKLDPRLLSALYQRAQANHDKGDTVKALVDADAAVAIARGEEHVRALIYRGRLRNNAKLYDGTIADCTAAGTEATQLRISDGALRAAAEVCLGLAQQSKGQLRDAALSYDRALQWDRNDVSALSGRGYVRFERGQYDSAISDFSAALKIDPRSQDALRFIGLAYSDKGDRAKADEAFARAISIDPKDPWPHMIRAISSARDGERDRAFADVAQALAITGQQSSDVVLVRGAVNYFLGDLEKARADLDASIRLNPNNGQAHRMLARLFIRQGRLDDAQRSQTEAARLLPRDATLLLQQGLIAVARKDYGNAVRDLTDSLEINDAHAEGFAARGQAHEGQGLNAAAISDYRNALAKLALDVDARAAVDVARRRLAALTTPAGGPPAPSDRPGEPSRPAAPALPATGPADASLYCRLAEGVFGRSRKYTGVEFETGCRQ